MKNLVFLFHLLFFSTYSFGQVECYTQDLSSNKEASVAYCGSFSDYRPDNPYIQTKYIRVNIHIMQKNDGTGNFQANDPQHMAYLNSIIPNCSARMQNIEQPYYGGATGDPYIVDSKIQFVLKGIYFHQDNIGWANNHSICSSYSFTNYKINDDTELNLFFTNGILPSDFGYHAGCGPGLFGENSNYVVTDGWFANYLQHPPGTYGQNHLGGAPWINNPHLLHEIGHCLNLSHSWYNSTFSDFPDIYNPQTNVWCSPANDFQCVNNIMGYSSTKTFLSPMQLEFLHKELTFSWRKKLVANCEETIT